MEAYARLGGIRRLGVGGDAMTRSGSHFRDAAIATFENTKSVTYAVPAPPRWRPVMTHPATLVRPQAGSTPKTVAKFRLELADRRVFRLDDKQWRAFQDILDRPVVDKPRLARLLAEKSVLE